MATSRARVRVLVASEHALIADTVRAALARGGHDVAVIGWPARSGQRPTRPSTPESLPEVGLLLCELDDRSTVRSAVSVVESIGVPWVVLTRSARGPSWGALLEAGVQLVLGEDTRLEMVGDVLLAVADGRAGTPVGERAELVGTWRELHAPHL